MPKEPIIHECENCMYFVTTGIVVANHNILYCSRGLALKRIRNTDEKFLCPNWKWDGKND